MSASDNPKGRIRVKGASPFTQIRIRNASLDVVPLIENAGNIEAALDLGLYQVGFLHGNEWTTEHVLLAPGQDIVDIIAPHGPPTLAWADAPEIAASRKADAANVVVELVSDGRDLLAKEQADRLDVLLVSPAGEETKPIYRDALVAGTWRFFVDAGHWRLRINDRSRAPAFELPVTVCPGWNVHIAGATTLVPDPEGPLREPVAAVDLERLRVRMVGADDQNAAFSADQLACEETALTALAAGHHMQGAEFEALLRDSTMALHQPMAAICAAHVLTAGAGASSASIDGMLDRLEQTTLSHPSELFQVDSVVHPDIACLRLRVRLARAEPIDDLAPVPFPPSLMAGWKALLEGARLRPDLVPEGSVSATVAGQIWSASTWVAWTASALDGEPAASGGADRPRARTALPSPSDGFETAREIVVAGLAHRPLREWFRKQREDVLSGSLSAISTDVVAIASLLQPALNYLHREGRASTPTVPLCANYQARDLDALSELSGLPPSSAAAATVRLAQHLLEEAQNAGIDLERRTLMARPDLIIPYDPHFLGDGFVVPMPQLTDAARSRAFASGAVLDYCHYSLVMRQDRRIAFFTANNVDAARKVSVSGGLTWQMDERVGEDQIGRETYDRNQIDKGHLVRREDVLWGSLAEARAANKSTYFYTNAAPQHQNFNQDEWKCLEDWVLQRATDLSYRLCVFTGPVLTDDDPTLEDLPPELRTVERAWGPAQLPAAFWKVIVLRDAEAGGSDLSAIAFAMKQSEMWSDKQGKRLLSLRVHQVTLEAIEQWTGLDFGSLRDIDELAFSPARGVSDEDSPWPTVERADDIVWSGPERRARGLRAQREGEAASVPRSVETNHTHDCCRDGFDAEAAVEALSQEFARLTSLVAGQIPGEPRSAGPRAAAAEEEDPRLAPPDDSRVEAIAAAASDEARDAVRGFARLLVGQSDIARGARPVPEASEMKRIVGGEDVPPGGFPHCVCIGTPDRWICTGALVAPQVVLTAAHCGGSIDRIAIGTQVKPGLSPDTRVVAVRRVAVHPGYRAHPYSENDITVLILASPAMGTPAGLAREADITGSSSVHLVGFGYNDPQRPLGFGRKREVAIELPPIIRGGQYGDTTQLEGLLGFHGEYEFVAGRKALGRDSCNGDSGGPAYVRVNGDWRVAGLTSRATREAVSNCGDGGIYVRPEHFRPWIDQIVASSALPPLAW